MLKTTKSIQFNDSEHVSDTFLQENKSWENHVIININNNIHGHEECQQLCQVLIINFSFNEFINVFDDLFQGRGRLQCLDLD